MSITIGNAVAALAFTIAIQQFLKPIHRFRLAARGVPLRSIFAVVYVAAALVLLGNTLRYFDPPSDNSLSISAGLEVLGGALFFLAYLGTTFISLAPAKFETASAPRFSRSAFRLLAKANDEDYVALFQDMAKNVVAIAQLASFNENYRWSGINHGEPSAFFDFIHRRKIQRSYFAGSLLHLLSDSKFCAAVIRNDSTSVIDLLRALKDANPRCGALGSLVQELAKQSILQEDSMLAREVGYTGFGMVRAFLDEMFGNPSIAQHYEPMQSVTSLYDIQLTSGITDRLAAAAELTWRSSKDVWHPQSLWPVADALKSAIQHARLQQKDHPEQRLHHFHLFQAVARICEITSTQVAAYQKLSHASDLYAKEDDPNHRINIAGLAAELAVEALMAISNDFAGIDDTQWTSTIHTMRAIFNSIGDEPDGLTPLQQRALLIIVEKLKDNMQGYYPALSRVLLAMIGPYQSHNQTNRTAFRILEDVAYGIWKDMGVAKANPEARVEHFLPPNVRYDFTDDTLTHTYRSGEQKVTHLGSLKIPVVNLLSEDVRRQP